MSTENVVTILILIDGFLQYFDGGNLAIAGGVTILILIDGFLQSYRYNSAKHRVNVTILILIDGFLQSYYHHNDLFLEECHNPYFNRWFSAISTWGGWGWNIVIVTILILIDGFLQ